MATTYTEHLQLPKHAPTDPFDITLINEMADKTEVGILTAYRGMAAYNLLDNSYFVKPYNQLGKTVYTGTANVYTIDRWLASTAAVSINLLTNGINIDNRANASANGHMTQRLEGVPDGTYTLCASTSSGMVLRTFTLSGGGVTTLSNVSAGVAFTGVGYNSTTGILTVQIGVQPSSVITVYWAALYEGRYTADTLPNYLRKGLAEEQMECMRYFHLYATEAARPENGLDAVPHMRIKNPTQGTVVIDGTTYYYNDANL